jgi:hypothetical protein
MLFSHKPAIQGLNGKKQACRFLDMSAMNGRWAFATATLLPLKKQKQLLFFDFDEFDQKRQE